MRNTAEFAEFVKNARGASTQEQINNAGGPVRQTQSRIENGEDFEITKGMLDMLDKAHKRPPGFFDAILQTENPVPASFNERCYRDAQFTPIVGYHAQTGYAHELPRRLQVTTGPFGFYPLFGMLNTPGIGTVLVDIATLRNHADGATDLPELLDRWGQRHPKSTPWTTVPELHLHHGFRPLIIDPLSAVSTLGQARDLVRRITNPTLGRSTDMDNATEHLAVTVALTAYLAKSQAMTTYQVLDQLTEMHELKSRGSRFGGHDPVREALDRFFSSGQLPATYRSPTEEIHRLLAGLQRLKTAFTHLEFMDPSVPPNVVTPPVTDFKALASSGPALIIYDGRQTPEFPAVTASGLANTPGRTAGELLIVAPAAVDGIERQDGYFVALRAPQHAERTPSKDYAELKVMATARPAADADSGSVPPTPLHRSFLGVFTADSRHSSMPIFLPGQ